MGHMKDQENRRRFLLTTAGLLAAGCQYNGGKGPLVRGVVASPEANQIDPPADSSERVAAKGAMFAYGPLVMRETWTKFDLEKNDKDKDLKYMSGQLVKDVKKSKIKLPSNNLPNRISVHHDAMEWKGRHDFSSARERLRKIQRYHMSKKWDGIGYHFAIDGRGHVWQCRPLKYQGAHVGDENTRNLGILVMGNFEVQHPTQNQLKSLEKALQIFHEAYKIPGSRIKGHKEYASAATLCPGKNLFPKFAAMRNRIA